MSIAAMNNSALALTAQSQALSTISQNISNVDTTGYKTSDTLFSTLLSESQATLDIFSVQGSKRTNVETQGAISTTGNWSDLAISGNGMFVLNSAMDGSGKTVFSRDGEFGIKAVDSNGDGTEDTGYLVDGNGNYLQGWSAGSDGTIDTTSSTLSSVHYAAATTIPGVATSAITLYGSVDAAATTDQQTAAAIYGPQVASDGTSSITSGSLSMLWSPSADTANAWNLTFSLPDATISNASSAVTFDGTGAMTSTGTTTLDVTWADGTTSQMAVDYSNITLTAGTSSVDYAQQDGYSAGNLSGVSFDSNGKMSTTYDNGHTITGYQVALADFVAPNSLQEMSGNVFAQTTDSGAYTLKAANSSSVSFVAGAVEASTVDLNDQFTKMVMTQTAYSSASKVFTVADEMVQTIYNLK